MRWTWLAFGWSLVACGSGELADFGGAGDAGGAGSPACFSASECPVGWSCSEFGVCVPPAGGGDAGVPEETEYEFGAPLASNRFVWVALTDADALARIDGETLEVTSLPVGEAPRVVATLPGTDTAIALDGLHGAAAVVRPADAGDRLELVPTLPRLNALAAAPGGRYAVAYFDLTRALAEAGGLAGVGEVGSFQDVTVIGLTDDGPTSVDLTVGFRPREVEFDAAGTTAFVVTDDGVSVIDLAVAIASPPTTSPPIALRPDPFVSPDALEVEITDDGAYAVVRESGRSALRVVALAGAAAGQAWDVPLPALPADVELHPDGTRAFAPLRATSQIAELTLPATPGAPVLTFIDLPGATVGSLTLANDGDLGVSYTNASLDERLTLIDLASAARSARTVPLQKAVRAVVVADDGAALVVLHARAPGDPEQATTVEEFVDRRPGYSLVDVASGFAKLQLTTVDPGPVVFAPDGERAFVGLDGGDAPGAVRAVDELALASGVVTTLPLGSPPDALGRLPASGRVFVVQRHGLGRITFVGGDAPTRTLTGFDLNGQIVD